MLWVQDDLRQSLRRAEAVCALGTPPWPGQRFEPVEIRNSMAEGGSLLRGMQNARDPAVRIRALEALGETGGAGDLDACLASLLDPEASVRHAAAEAVVRLCQRPGNDPVAERLLLRVFEIGTQWGSRERAAIDAALPRWAPVLCAPATQSLNSEEASTQQRAIAAYCLGRMACFDAADALSALVWDKDAALAREAASALYRLRDPESTRLWVGLARHTDPVVQRLSIEALAALGDSLALEALTSMALGEGEYSGTLQILATNALAVWPKEVSIPRLIRAMTRNPTVRSYAVARLREITRLPIGDIPNQWQDWYETGELPEGVEAPRTGDEVEVEVM